MALPRRPYLLGLFPGTSNDWADTRQGEGGEHREEGEEMADWKKEQKEHIIRSHAHRTKNLNSTVQQELEKGKLAAWL